MASSKSVPPSEDHAERLLKVVGTMLDQMLLQEPSEDGRPIPYNPKDYSILKALEASDGLSGSEIARRFGLPRTSIQSALDRLEKSDLIEKRPDPAGGRIKTLHLTTAGQAIRAKMNAHDLQNMRTMLAPLSEDERTLVLPLLERVADAIENAAKPANT
ncbi:MarR family winged helix-turn-helix transcriptional regulator [Erythrobacter sp. NAP1]|uniref:MarR family winged helix-turn-helix transcriptional regulator n=1 Tax=Erythrobacter sp. NAP1 TaxID=237727 RepID=UPI0002FFD606|nr:MarR family transcriptional regulator [Erythrobacter sp. NAP1]